MLLEYLCISLWVDNHLKHKWFSYTFGNLLPRPISYVCLLTYWNPCYFDPTGFHRACYATGGWWNYSVMMTWCTNIFRKMSATRNGSGHYTSIASLPTPAHCSALETSLNHQQQAPVIGFSYQVFHMSAQAASETCHESCPYHLLQKQA